mmetsp:Transcript_27402/g.57660  ORF Transcript_27402/g.57660 Transcript_27402/m.57660 type:complete len:222 (-) Transcript_27402:1108-1773(-)
MSEARARLPECRFSRSNLVRQPSRQRPASPSTMERSRSIRCTRSEKLLKRCTLSATSLPVGNFETSSYPTNALRLFCTCRVPATVASSQGSLSRTAPLSTPPAAASDSNEESARDSAPTSEPLQPDASASSRERESAIASCSSSETESEVTEATPSCCCCCCGCCCCSCSDSESANANCSSSAEGSAPSRASPSRASPCAPCERESARASCSSSDMLPTPC